MTNSHKNTSIEILRQRFEIEKLKSFLQVIEDIHAIFHEINSVKVPDFQPHKLCGFEPKLDEIDVRFAAAIAELDFSFHIDLSSFLADEMRLWKTERFGIDPRPRIWPNLCLYANCYYLLMFPSNWGTKFSILRLRAETRLANLSAVFGQSRDTKRKDRGRPKRYDHKKDKRVFDSWQSNAYKTFAELGVELRMTAEEVRDAIGRHRKR